MGHHAATGRAGDRKLIAMDGDMPDFNADELEEARRLFAGPCDFMWGSTSLATLPPPALPEIAFAGRSNVGKSSLVNALTGRKTLARTSNTPGRTQQLNFFLLGAAPGRAVLVDLPGYGYAKVSKSRVRDWTRLTRDYLKGRMTLRRVMVLVDARHGLKPADREMLKLLDESAVSSQIVLTKIDKLDPPARATMLEATIAAARTHVACHPRLHDTSALKDRGIAELRAEILGLITQ